MNYVFYVIVWILLTIAALPVFQVTWWKAVLFFLAGCVLEITLELCMMIIIYASDRVPERVVRGICLGLKLLLAGITIAIVLYFKKEGLSVESAIAFADWPVLQMLPIMGWHIACLLYTSRCV